MEHRYFALHQEARDWREVPVVTYTRLLTGGRQFRGFSVNVMEVYKTEEGTPWLIATKTTNCTLAEFQRAMDIAKFVMGL